MNRFALLTLPFLFLIHSGAAQTYYGTGGIISDDGTISDFITEVPDLSPDSLTTNHGLKPMYV